MNELLSLLRETFPAAWVRVLVILAASLVLAWILRVLVWGALRVLARRTRTTLDDRLLAVLRRPLTLTALLGGLDLAVRSADPPGATATLTHRILVTLLILVWTGAGFRICSTALEEMGRLADRVRWIEARTIPLLDNLGKVVLVGLALYALLKTWSLDVTPWLASAGIVGIAVGFAAKDTLANLFGGVFILADAPFQIGDFIVLDSGERGRVTRIGLRSSRILTQDDVEIILPNAQIANSKIVNESGGPWTRHRVTVSVGVAYGSDVEQVRRVLLEAAGSVAEVCSDPEPRVRFTAFGASSLDFRLLAWVEEPVLRGRILDALNTEVYHRFRAEGIEIPFPQRVVHLPGELRPSSPV